MKDCRRDPCAPGDASCGSPPNNAFAVLVVSENVAKLIAILATFSRTGHNWARLDFCGIAL
jgi:hypothetical protein